MITRRTAVKYFNECLADSDIVFYSGKDLSLEAQEFDRFGNFYMYDSGSLVVPLALGTAINTDRRVFVVMGDGDFLREMGTMSQLAVSKCKNIFCVILNNGVYQSLGNHPSIVSEIKSLKGLVFNFGFLVHDYTKYMNNKLLKNLRDIVSRIVGPLVIIVNINNTKNKNIDYTLALDNLDMKSRFCNFLNSDLETSLFNPPSI